MKDPIALYKKVLLILFILTVICYGQTLNYPFVYDDIRVLKTPTTDILWDRSISPNRSVVSFTFYLNKVIFGNEPIGFRIFNILIHLANGFLVFLLLHTIVRIKQNVKIVELSDCVVPLLCSCIFIVHPLAIQSTTYLSQRFNSLAAFFFLGTVLFFLWGRETKSRKLLIISLVSSLLAFLSKEFTVSLIVIIPLLEFIFFYKKEQKIESVFLTLPFFLTGLTIPVIHFLPAWFPSSETVSSSFLPSWAPLEKISRANYLLTQIDSVFSFYSSKFFLPLDLSVYPSVELVSYFSFANLIYISIFSFIILCSINFIKKYTLASLGVFWIILTLGPTSSLIPNTELVAEHRFYIPSVGFYFIFLELSFMIKNRVGEFILVLFVLLLVPLNYFRNQVWSSEEKLWADAVQQAPTKARPFINLAGIYLDQGQNKLANKFASKALEISKNDPKALFIVGRTLELSNPNLARKQYMKIINIFQKTKKPQEYYRAQLGLALLLYNAQEYSSSMELILPIYEKNLLLSECHKLLAYNYYATNQLGKALFHFKNGRRLRVAFHPEFSAIFLKKKTNKTNH
ncbi:MAG: hypothetical protein COA79_21405 [Planctomycetota bacterium]|nr:MAG: hypothetical protein COA79_21405 [Planctomycetota bacterium]